MVDPDNNKGAAIKLVGGGGEEGGRCWAGCILMNSYLKD